MNIDDLNFDFNQLLEGIKDGFFKMVRIIFIMFFNLPIWIRITLAILFVLFVIGIAVLTWKYRDKWRYVEY